MRSVYLRCPSQIAAIVWHHLAQRRPRRESPPPGRAPRAAWTAWGAWWGTGTATRPGARTPASGAPASGGAPTRAPSPRATRPPSATPPTCGAPGSAATMPATGPPWGRPTVSAGTPLPTAGLDLPDRVRALWGSSSPYYLPATDCSVIRAMMSKLLVLMTRKMKPRVRAAAWDCCKHETNAPITNPI